MYPDLLFHFGIKLEDVIAGQGPHPKFVLSCLQRLPDTSLTTALVIGGREHFGWGKDLHMATNIFDALNQNTRVSMMIKNPPKIPLAARPKPKQDEKEAPKGSVLTRLFGKLSGKA